MTNKDIEYAEAKFKAIRVDVYSEIGEFHNRRIHNIMRDHYMGTLTKEKIIEYFVNTPEDAQD